MNPAKPIQRTARPVRGSCSSPPRSSHWCSREGCGCGPARRRAVRSPAGRSSPSARCWHATSGVARHLSDPRQGFPPRCVRAYRARPASTPRCCSCRARCRGITAAAQSGSGSAAAPAGAGDSKDHGARWARAGDLVRAAPTPTASTAVHPVTATADRLAIMTGARTLARLPGNAAAPRRGSPRAGRVRPDPVGQVGGDRDPEHPRMGRARRSSSRSNPTSSTPPSHHAQQRGEALVFDPFAFWKQPSHTWSPLAAASTWNAALSRPRSGWPPPARLDTSTGQGRELLVPGRRATPRPLLYAAARTGRGMGDVVRWVYGQGGAELDRIMHRPRREQPRRRSSAPMRSRRYDCAPRLHASSPARPEGRSRAPRRSCSPPTAPPPSVRSADGNQITGQRLLDGANTVYVISDSRRSKLLRPILIALLTELARPRLRNRQHTRPAGGCRCRCSSASTSSATRSRSRTSRRSPRPPPRTTSS